MDFICPNCAKMITVPDQYAGQPMRCPLCQQTFQAPSLPSSGPVPAMPLSEPAPTVDEGAYRLSPEQASPFAPSPAPQRVESSRPQPKAPPPPPPSPPPAGFARKFSLQLNPQILPWIPAGALVLVFFLTFFNWVGMYPGGIGVMRQNAWQALYGGYDIDPVFETKVFPAEFETNFDKNTHSPGWSASTFFYILSFLPTLALVVAITLASQLQVKLPPAVHPYWQWRYLAVAAVALIPLFFMLLQSLAGFPLEDKMKSVATSKFEGDRRGAKTDDDIKRWDIEEGMAVGKLVLRRTLMRSLALILHILAPLCALLAFWLERRGSGRPLPRMEALW